MINSLDRISVATSDLERSKKTFNDFFDSSPAFEVEEKNIGYKSLIYNFENTRLELISHLGSKENSEFSNFFIDNPNGGLFGFSLRCENKEIFEKMKVSPFVEIEETTEENKITYQTNNLKQSKKFKLSLNHYDSPLPNKNIDSDLFALDHLVVKTNSGDNLVNLYKEKLGIRLALDQMVEEWGGRMLFFRTGHATIEVIDNKVPGEDNFWGLAWKTKNIEKTCERLAEKNLNVSEVRKGRKKDTLVATVKFDEIKIPTLLVEHLK